MIISENLKKYAAIWLCLLSCNLTGILGQIGHVDHGMHSGHDGHVGHGVVDRHVDGPFQHGNNRPVPAVHTTSVIGGGYGGRGVGGGLGFGVKPGTVPVPLPAIHPTSAHGGHLVHGVGHGVVDRHIDGPFQHGNLRPVPAVHTTSVVGGHPIGLAKAPLSIGRPPVGVRFGGRRCRGRGRGGRRQGRGRWCRRGQRWRQNRRRNARRFRQGQQLGAILNAVRGDF